MIDNYEINKNRQVVYQLLADGGKAGVASESNLFHVFKLLTENEIYSLFPALGAPSPPGMFFKV